MPGASAKGTPGISVYSHLLMRQLLLILALVCAQIAGAQTVIELDRGGTVRGKTIDDYKEETGMAERLRADSLQYVDDLRRAFNALHEQKPEEAETYFKSALKLRPDAPGNHIIHYNLAQIQRAREEYLPALQTLNTLLKNVPNYYDARLARAEINLELGNAREAIDDAEVLLNNDALKQTEADIYRKARFVRAAARYHAHLYVEARTDVRTLLLDDPQNANAQILEALILQKMGQPKEALNSMNRIVSAHPESVDALLTRAALYTELGMHAPARADYDKLISLNPKDGNLYVERARTSLNLNEKTAARRDLDEALKLGVPRGVVQALYNLTRK